jgi:hypothetical protein
MLTLREIHEGTAEEKHVWQAILVRDAEYVQARHPQVTVQVSLVPLDLTFVNDGKIDIVLTCMRCMAVVRTRTLAVADFGDIRRMVRMAARTLRDDVCDPEMAPVREAARKRAVRTAVRKALLDAQERRQGTLGEDRPVDPPPHITPPDPAEGPL